ncbi:MAG TPA: hypothetical protein VM577_08285 [Anaerovoracaceae bacterium]|nr:hypothetical protein [Anaerovoracaceae bacterium]
MKIAIVICLAIWILSSTVFFFISLGARNKFSFEVADWEALTAIGSLLIAILSFIGFAVCLTWRLL